MMMLLVDISHADTNLRGFLKNISWWNRLEAFGCEIAVWSPTENDNVKEWPTVSHWEEVVLLAKKSINKKVIYITADQLFLDQDVVISGIQMAPFQWDYFTQWEHSRLPVGIGIRAFSLENSAIATWNHTPQDLIQYIQQHPKEFAFCYDPEKYV